MKLKSPQIRIIYGVVSMFILAGAIAGAFYLGQWNKASAQPASSEETLMTVTPRDWIYLQLLDQAQTEQMLLDELDTGSYSLQEPLVVLDPYGYSPLTALLVFTTEVPCQISIHIPGKDELSSIDFSFDGYQTEHFIPVYGLYPDQINQVVLDARTKDGKNTEVLVPIETQPLPNVVTDVISLVRLEQPDQYQPGFNFSYSSSLTLGAKLAFDVNGDNRWYLPGEFGEAVAYDVNGHIILAMGDLEGSIYFIEINPLGKIYRAFTSAYGAHHDIEPYGQNHLLITGSNEQSTPGFIEDFIYEVDLETGKVVNKLDLKTVFSRARDMGQDQQLDLNDWLHLNAIVTIPGEDSILISARDQSMIAKMTWPAGEVEWISTPSDGLLPMFESRWLTPIGNQFEHHYMQHAPYLLPDMDNDADTMDLLVFDNGTDRPVEEGTQLYSRMVQYRINEKDMTIEQIREYGKEQGTALFSERRGDADFLPNGNWLGSFCIEIGGARIEQETNVSVGSSVYLEINEDNELVWMVERSTNQWAFSYLEYRTERMDIYQPTANQLGIGEAAISLIP
jgi:arylsulfate sulfotransferase